MFYYFDKCSWKGCVHAKPLPLLQPSFISTPSPLTHPHTPILQSNHLAQDFLNPTPTSCFRHSVLRFIPGTFAWIL